jgi:hypothetical protein
MNPTTPLEITITLIQPDLDDLDLERLTQQFYQRLTKIPDLIAVERVKDETIVKGDKGGRYLIGVLRAQATADRIEAIANSTYDYSKSGCAILKVTTANCSSDTSTAELTKSEFVERVRSNINE